MQHATWVQYARTLLLAGTLAGGAVGCDDGPPVPTTPVAARADASVRGHRIRRMRSNERGGPTFTVDHEASTLADDRGHRVRLDSTARAKLEALFDVVERGDSLAAFVAGNRAIRKAASAVPAGTRTRVRSVRKGGAPATVSTFGAATFGRAQPSAPGPRASASFDRHDPPAAGLAPAFSYAYNGNICEDLSYTLQQETQQYNDARAALTHWLAEVGLGVADVDEFGNMVWNWKDLFSVSTFQDYVALAYDVLEAKLALNATAAQWNANDCWSWQYQNSDPAPTDGGGGGSDFCYDVTYEWDISYDGGVTWYPYMYADVTVCYSGGAEY